MDKQTKTKFNLIAIVCIIIFSIAITPVTLQNDTFYTIKIGEHILNTGAIDMSQDPFSIHEIPYTYPHWLYDVGIYLIYQAGGMTGIYISTVILACILGVTVYLTNKKIVKNELVSFLLTLGVMYILTVFIAARAQLVTFTLFALGIYFIERFLETKKKRYAVALVLIPIVIANIHLAVWPFYFIIFLPYIAEYLIVLISDSHLFYKAQCKFYDDKIKKLEKRLSKEENKDKLNEKISKEESVNKTIEKSNEEEKINKLKEKQNKIKENFDDFVSKQAKRRENPYRIKMQRNDAAKWLILIVVICAFTGLLTPLGDTPYTYLIKTMRGKYD